MIEVGILARPHLHSHTSLVVVEYLLRSKPLILKLFIQPIDLGPQCFRVDIPSLDQLSELFFWYYDVSLGMSPK